MINNKFIVLFLSLGFYGFNGYAMEPIDQKRSQESRSNEAQLDLALFRSAESCMDRVIDRHQREMHEELVEMITATEAKLAQTADQKEREELIDATTHFLVRETSYAPAIALWLKGSGKPNNIASISTTSPLFKATQSCNIEGMEVLLADPRTKISEKELFLHIAIANGSAKTDQNNLYKKILRLLLFFGVDPHAKIGKNLTAQETADAFKGYDPEYSKLMKNHKNIAGLLSPEELAEFDTIMKLRMHRNHAVLMRREIGGRSAKMGKKVLLPKADHQQQAVFNAQPHNGAAGARASQVSTVTFKWPKQDSK